MTVDWRYLIEVLAMLLYPLGLGLGSRVQLRRYNQVGNGANDAGWLTSWITVPRLWADPLRSFLGIWLLRQDDVVFHLPADASESVARQPMLITVGIVAAALLVQCFAVRSEDGDELLAPIGFATGLIAALAPPLIAVFGVVLAVLGATGLRTWSGYFLGGAVGMVATGYVLGQGNEAHPFFWTAIGAGLLCEPVLLAIIMRREFVIPVRQLKE
jgi:hypothetical protein